MVRSGTDGIRVIRWFADDHSAARLPTEGGRLHPRDPAERGEVGAAREGPRPRPEGGAAQPAATDESWQLHAPSLGSRPRAEGSPQRSSSSSASDFDDLPELITPEPGHGVGAGSSGLGDGPGLRAAVWYVLHGEGTEGQACQLPPTEQQIADIEFASETERRYARGHLFRLRREQLEGRPAPPPSPAMPEGESEDSDSASDTTSDSGWNEDRGFVSSDDRGASSLARAPRARKEERRREQRELAEDFWEGSRNAYCRRCGGWRHTTEACTVGRDGERDSDSESRPDLD